MHLLYLHRWLIKHQKRHPKVTAQLQKASLRLNNSLVNVLGILIGGALLILTDFSMSTSDKYVRGANKSTIKFRSK